jgi:hypothetical protein
MHYCGSEFRLGGEQAGDQPARFRHAEEVAGMDPDSMFQELEGGLFAGANGGYAQDGVPAAFDLEAFDFWRERELAIELGEVGRDALPDLFLDLGAAG